MAGLQGTRVNATYGGLLRMPNNTGITGTLQAITDGAGNSSAVSISSAAIGINGNTLTVGGTSSINGTFTGTTSGTNSGTNTGDQTISLTGDVTASGGTGALTTTVAKINGNTLGSTTPADGRLLVGQTSGAQWITRDISGDVTVGSTGIITIATNAVTVAKMAQVAAHKLLGNISGSTANVAAVATSNFIQNINFQPFVSSGTYTPITGMIFCVVEIVAGGGGGGGCAGSSNSAGAGGGGGGNYVKTLYTAAQIGSTATVTIGAAGAAGTAGANNGGTGGNSSFIPTTGTTTVNGGVGGTGGSTSSAGSMLGGGAGGVISSTLGGTVLLNIAGATGGIGFGAGTTSVGLGGSGGNSFLGSGAYAGGTNSAGLIGTGQGAGGSGAGSIGGGNLAGGAGTKGGIFITEYIAV